MQIQGIICRIVPGEFLSDTTAASLVCANLITIVLAVAGQWDLATIIFIYLLQSIIIGVFTVLSLLTADTSALVQEMARVNADRGVSLDDYPGAARFLKLFLAGFFALHYGLFHWGYYSFIVESGLFGPVDVASSGVRAACLIFFVNHLYSWLSHRRDARRGGTFILEEFVRPYARIVPMHLTIMFGSVLTIVLSLLGFSAGTLVLVLFLLLKTYTDLRMHLAKHDGERQSDEISPLISV